MKHILYLLILFLAALGLASASDVAPTGETSVTGAACKYSAMGQTTNDFLSFAIGLEKQTFIIDEPIEVTFILTNNSEQRKRLAEPNWNVSMVHIKVAQIEGEEPIPSQPMPMMPGSSADFGWDFGPGESKFSVANILDLFPNGIPAGRYSVQGIYRVKDFLNVDWYGTMESEPVEFSIVNPATEREDEVRQIYTKIRKFVRQRKTISSAIGMSSDIQVLGEVGTFNKYVAFYEADAYRMLGDADQFKIKMMSYLDLHGKNDRNSILGISMLGDFYRTVRKDYDAARVIYKLLPDGYDRMNYLRLCDISEAQQEEPDNTVSGSGLAP